MSDETKTKEQLLAEIEALKKRLEVLDGKPPEPVTSKPAGEPASAPVLAKPITRRGSFGWVAPVILSVPAVQTATMLATVFRPGTAQAAVTRPPTLASTRAPTLAPTRAVGKCVPAPTAAPTVAPTLGMASAPDCRPCEVSVPLGAARALSRAKLGRARRSDPSCLPLSA